MKNLLFLLFCFLQLNAFSQHPYIPIPEDSVLWVVVDENWHESDPSHPPHTFTYGVSWLEGRDTVVNNTRYLCMYGGAYTDMPPQYGIYSAKSARWIRQDSNTKKVWQIYKGSPPNYIPSDFGIIYDFSLQVGDTFNDPAHLYFYSPAASYKVWVDAIDSVYWADGTWRYRWFIKSDLGASWGNPAHAIQIEGMGYTTGWTNPFMRWIGVFNNTYEVTCFGVKGQWLFHQPNPWNFNCDSMIARNMLGTLSAPDVFTNELEQPLLYPNPVSASSTLTLNKYAGPSQELHWVQAYDIHGRLVLATDLIPGNSIELINYSLHPGIYFFRVSNNKRQIVYTSKFIIQ